MKIKKICIFCQKEYFVDPTLGNWDIENKQKKVTKNLSSTVVNSAKYCCYCCGKKHTQEKIVATNLKKYGVKNVGESKEIKEKIADTSLKKYGVTNPGQGKVAKEKREKTFQKFEGGHPFADKQVRKKIQQTLKNHYGVVTPSLSSEIVEKRRQTSLDKRGVECPFQDELVKQKSKETCIEKYGVEYASQDPNIRQRIANTYKNNYNKDIKLKKEQTSMIRFGVKHHTQCEDGKNVRKKTCRERYGVDCYLASEQMKMRYKDPDYMAKITKKQYETRKRNNSWVTSAPEEKIKELLLKRYNVVEYQYKSDNYPFNCDFYIPELDLYIEYQGHWSHGPEPFNKNNEQHVEILKKWRSKKRKGYDDSIYVWTQLDVKKRTIAKNNKINIKEFFSLEDFLKWYNKNEHATGDIS